MSSHDDTYMDDYDYYQHTGEPSEYFEDEEEDEYEIIENEQQNQGAMTNIKLKYLNGITELNDVEVTKFGAELKGLVFRSIDERLTLFLEFVPIPNRRRKDDLFIKVILYDKEGDILNTEDECIEPPYFKGNEVVKMTFGDVVPSSISRIVINFQKM